MDNLESTSDKLKIERLSDLVKSLYENIDDLKSRLDEKNITQNNKAFDELYEKHRNLEKDFATMGKSFDKMEKDFEESSEELHQANLIIGNQNKELRDSFSRLDTVEEAYRKLMDSFMQKKKWIEELKDADLQKGRRFNKLTLEYNEKIATTMNERDYYKERVVASEAKLSQAEETIASYQKTYETLRKELEEANHLSLTMRTMYENLYDNYRDCKVELAELKEYMREVLVRNYDFIKTVGKLEKEKAILENNAAKHEKEIENLAAIISGMENELNKKDFENNELNYAVHLASYILGNHNDYPRD